eukprot:gene1490-1715_t
MPTATPSAKPTAEPTATPSAKPTAEPTATPSAKPTAEPTATPSAKPTAEPTVTQSAKPTAEPTATPSALPTVIKLPTLKPTVATKRPVHKAPSDSSATRRPSLKPAPKPHPRTPKSKDSVMLNMHLKMTNGGYGKQNIAVKQFVEVNAR